MKEIFPNELLLKLKVNLAKRLTQIIMEIWKKYYKNMKQK